MNKYLERLYNGLIKENPTFILMLGMCPTLAVTSSAINGLGMGLSTTVVLIFSNLLISLFRKVIPNGVRMPAFIVIVASLVTIVQFLLQAYVPTLSSALGVYIPLIVVNCIILGRAESYASKNTPLLSIFDGIGMGLGFTFGLTCIGLVREILGAGTAFNVDLANGLLSRVIAIAIGSNNPNFPVYIFILVWKIVVFLIALVIGLLLAMSMRKKQSAFKVFLMAADFVLALGAFVALLGFGFTNITIFIMAPGAFLVLAVLVVVMNLVRAQMDKQGTPLPEPQGCFACKDCASCGLAGGCPTAKVEETNEGKEEK